MNLLIQRFVKDYENISCKSVRNSYGKFSSIVGIILNLFLFAIKLTAGLFSGSVSIIADSVNNLSDASSSVISLIGFRLSNKPADKDHPFGHGRYEYIAAMMVAVLIMVIGVELLKTGISKIIHPEMITITWFSVTILLLSIAVKAYMMFFNRKIGLLINSNSLIATSQDSRNDVITTGAVLASALVMKFFEVNIDGYVAVAVALFILISGLNLIKETLDPILGRKPDPELVKELNRKICSYENINGVHDLLVHDYGPGNNFASVHVEMDADLDPIIAHDEIDNIEKDILNELGIHLVIHYDPILTNDSETQMLRVKINEIVKNINSHMSMHDLRIVPGITHTNVVFDIVVPDEVKKDHKEIRKLIIDEVTKINPNYCCVITIDYEFASME